MPGLDERVMPPSSPGISSQTPGISSQTPGSSGGGQLKPPGPGGPSPVFGSSSKVILPIPAEPVSFGGDVTNRSSSSDIAYSQHAHVSFGGSSFTSTPFSTNTSAAAPVLGNSFGTTTADDDALKIAASNKLNSVAVAFTPRMFSSGLDNPKPAADDNPFLQNASFPKRKYSVTKAICQFSSKQDVEPAYLNSKTHMALLAGDGHGGDLTTKALSSNAHVILEHVLKDGLEAGMRFSQELCKEFGDGAMLVLALYEFSNRTLKILSVGDASCCVYQHEKLIHHQPHQDAEAFALEHPDGTPGVDLDGNEFGRVELQKDSSGSIKKYGKLKPRVDGIVMDYPLSPAYFTFKVGQTDLPDNFASGAFVGHKDYPRLPARSTECVIPEGPFHVVMTSDGVSDVMHHEDHFLVRSDANAFEILDECKKRWLKEWQLNGEGRYLTNLKTIIRAGGRLVKTVERLPNGYYRVVFNDGETRTVATIDETNKGADDISVLVFRYD
jgi:hypothetical protein